MNAFIERSIMFLLYNKFSAINNGTLQQLINLSFDSISGNEERIQNDVKRIKKIRKTAAVVLL